jgi:hypothetical protein
VRAALPAMSTNSEGRIISCDGACCKATTRGVVALRPSPARQRETDNWVFVLMGETRQHFCPACAKYYLKDHLRLTDPAYAV